MMKPYPKYKESGIDWIGKIPSHWTSPKTSYLMDYIGSGTTPKTTNEEYYGGDIPWVTTGELKENVIYESKKNVTELALAENTPLKVHPVNSIVIPMYGATIGRLAKLGIPSTTNQACCVLPPSKHVNTDFLYYWLMCHRKQLIELGYGGGQPNISQDTISNLRISLPSQNEQIQITEYLDINTARIDKLIAEKESFIKLLQEKRQALVSHVVTKGIDENVKLKPSGADWIGDIPEGWKVVSIRNLILSNSLDVQDGNHGELHPVAEDYVDEGIPFLMANSVRDGTVDYIKAKKISYEQAQSLRIGFANSNDVLLTHKGTVGEVALVPEKIEEPYWMLTPQVTYYRFKKVSEYLPKYFYHQFQSKPFQTQLQMIGGEQSTRAYIGIVAQRELQVVVPPFSKQESIAAYLDEKLIALNKLLEQSKCSIELLKEHRTALISAAVTGKIDVREAV